MARFWRYHDVFIMPNPCENCREQMLDYLPPRNVDDASTHIVPPTEVEAHLATCFECTREWTRLQNMTAALHELPITSAPIDLRAKIRSQIVDEQSAKKKFWHSFALRPQRVAWAGGVVLGGLLLVLAAQQPVSFTPQNESSEELASAPAMQAPSQAPSTDAAKNSQSDVKKVVPPKTSSAPNAQTQKPKVAATPSSGGQPVAPSVAPETSPSTDNSSTDNSSTDDSGNQQGALRPTLPSTVPSAPVMPPSPVAPPSGLPPLFSNERMRTGASQAAQQGKASSDKQKAAATTKKQANRASTQNATTAARPGGVQHKSSSATALSAGPPGSQKPAPKPQNSASPMPNVFADSAPIVKKTAPQPVKPSIASSQERIEDSATNESVMASRADETQLSATAKNEDSSAKISAAEGSSRRTTRSTAGAQSVAPAPQSSGGNRTSPGALVAPSAPNTQAGGAYRSQAAPSEAENQRQVFTFSTQFIPQRRVKKARLRVVLPAGAEFTSPSSTQSELVVWRGAASANTAIPISLKVQSSTDDSQLRVILEEKRGDTWRSVQEQKFSIASP